MATAEACPRVLTSVQFHAYHTAEFIRAFPKYFGCAPWSVTRGLRENSVTRSRSTPLDPHKSAAHDSGPCCGRRAVSLLQTAAAVKSPAHATLAMHWRDRNAERLGSASTSPRYVTAHKTVNVPVCMVPKRGHKSTRERSSKARHSRRRCWGSDANAKTVAMSKGASAQITSCDVEGSGHVRPYGDQVVKTDEQSFLLAACCTWCSM